MRLNVEHSLRKAAALITKRQPVEASLVVAEILEKFPKNVRAQELLDTISQQAKVHLPHGILNQLYQLVCSGNAAKALDLASSLPPTVFGSGDLQVILGQALGAIGRHDEAENHFRAATTLQPRQFRVWLAAGNGSMLAEKWRSAEECFDKARVLAPSNEDVLNNLGMSLAAQRKFDAAEVVFSTATSLHPQSSRLAYNRANALRDAGRLDHAIESYRHSLNLQPNYAYAANNLGTVLHQLGRDTEAEEAYMQAVATRPDYAQAHRNLSAVHRYMPTDPLIQVLDKNLVTTTVEQDRMYFAFARSKAHEDCQQYPQAFDRLFQANSIRKKLLRYDIATDKLLFSTLRQLFEVPIMALDCEPIQHRPVFILGMMRSGTTLVEQILSSHSEVYGAGELETFGQLCLPLMEEFYARGHRPSASELCALRKSYLSEIGKICGSEGVITDKMPVNFRWIGFILAALPEARIIHMKRDPIAVCWSIFKHYFSSDGNGYAFDLDDVAAYWHLYNDLMHHWHRLFPGQILDVPYEELTEEPERWSRKIVGFSGLSWQDKCLDFHLNSRAVKTASASQVKQKIYKGSSEAWRKYEVQLAPLIAALER